MPKEIITKRNKEKTKNMSDLNSEIAKVFLEDRGVLSRILIKRVGSSDPHLIEDLVGQTAVKTLTQQHTYNPNLGEVRGWVFVLAANLGNNYSKFIHTKRKRREIHSLTFGNPSELPPTIRSYVELIGE